MDFSLHINMDMAGFGCFYLHNVRKDCHFSTRFAAVEMAGKTPARGLSLTNHEDKNKFVYLLPIMKFYEKYPQLKEQGFLAQVLTNTVFSTMSLENQQVVMSKVQEIVLSLLKERALKDGQFFSNQNC